MQSNVLHTVIMRTFPPPRFLEMPSVGLDVTDQRIRFLEFTEKKNELVINRHGDMSIPPGVIVSGEIKRPKELTKLLKKFRRTHNIEFVHVSLPEQRAYLVKITVPDVAVEEVRSAITYQLEEHVPIPPEEVVFDYHVIGPSKQKKGDLDIAVSVLTKKEVNEYVEMFDGTGLRPLSFEIEAQAIARAVVPKTNKGTYVVVDFGGVRTGLSVVNEGIVRFTTTIDVGSDMLTKAIEKLFDISEAEAKKMKNERSIARDEKNRQFTEAVMASLSILRDEINRLFIYWQTHRKEESEGGIEQIYLCGGGANLKGLPEYLSSSLRVPIVVADPWVNVNAFDAYVPEIEKRYALGYTSVIGLALTRTNDIL